MKKIASTVFALLLCSAAFCMNDSASLSLHAGLSFPQIYNLNTTRTNGSGDKADSELYSGVGLDFGGRMPVEGQNFGIFAEGNLYMPYSYTVKWGNTSETYKMDSSNSFWGIEGTVGPYWVLLNSGTLVIPVGAGLHVNYIRNTSKISSALELTSSAFSLGAGAFINAELNLKTGMSFFASLHLNYDFWEKNSYKTTMKYSDHNTTTTDSDTSGISQLFVVPVLGVMWRF